MRFGVFVPQGWRLDLEGVDAAKHWPVLRKLASDLDTGAERSWESLWVYDHFHSAPFSPDAAVHEAWTLISALAASTEHIRLGQMCTCMGYRNPMYLAKAAATCDTIAAGRMEMGIGAGWYEHEWRAYGYGFPGAGDRLGMLEEGVEIMRQAWTTGSATLAGQHYQVDDARCFPTPPQDGGIPLWIAGGGEKRTLRIVARFANYTNFDGTLGGFARKSEILRGHCETEGRDFDSITRSANYNVLIAASEAELERKQQWLFEHLAARVGTDVAAHQMSAYRGMPAHGTPQQIIDKLGALGEQGMSYAICYFPDLAYTRDSLELFTTEVIPALR